MSANPDQFSGEYRGAENAIEASRYLVLETAEMQEADDDGAMAIGHNEAAEILRWDTEGPLLLYAIGANDARGVEYRLKMDGDIIANTASPLGTIANPFSFVDIVGAPIEADESIVLEVFNQSGNELDFAGRGHIGVLG